MFCDLAASTQLAGQLDPEDLRDIMRDYQSTSGVVIERFEGYIAQYLGDGLLVYFGWPQAHEDDPQRAVHTALGIIEAIGTLNTRLEADYGVQLAVRLGIHTGLVVVGEIGTGDRHENLALGETPNIAARLENLAQSNTAVMSAATFRLIQGFFDCDLLGEYDLKGVSQPLVAYRALHASEAQSRLDAVGSRGLTPLVGRQGEMDQLIEGWRQTQRGLGQVLLIQGEAVLGKSRLLQTLKDQCGYDRESVRRLCVCCCRFIIGSVRALTPQIYKRPNSF
jgi:class 3 adenylate cyclase